MRIPIQSPCHNNLRLTYQRRTRPALLTQEQNDRRTSRIATAILLLAVCVAYANSFGNSFHLDDFHTVVNNPSIRSLHNVPRFFKDATSFSVLPANQTYRPLVSTSLAFDYALAHGYVPFWFHLTTFLLFLLLVWLLSRFYETLFAATEPSLANRWLALIAAAWFGLHPAIAETVNYIIQRGDLFCTLECVAALYIFAAHPKQRRYGLYLLPFIAAMFSKPPAAVFPALLFLYVFYFENEQQPSKTRFRLAAVAIVPSLAVDALLLWLQSAMTPKTFTPATISAADYRITQPFVWLRYFGELWLPLHLNVDTDLNPFTQFNNEALAGFLFVLALVAAIVICSRRRRLYPIAFGLLWFVITQLPTSLYTLSEVENDHRMFFSFAGLIPAAVWTLWLLWLRFTSTEQRISARPILLGSICVALIAYGSGAFARNFVWYNEESLWHDDVLKSPANGRGLMNYGLTQMNVGRYKIALDYFERALHYTPNYPTLEINLGVDNEALAEAGEPSRRTEAERHFERAVALAPNADEPHTFYGRFLLQQERLNEAVAQLEAAIALNPQTLMPRELLIDADTQLGDTGAARTIAQQTLAIAPDDIPAQQALAPGAGTSADYWINLSLAQYKREQYAQSIASARHALTVNPKSAIAWNNIGAAQGAMHQWTEAIASEHQAISLDPTLQIAKNNLDQFTKDSQKPKTAADLLNESLELNKEGRLDESIASARAALKLDPKMAEAWNNIAAGYEGLHRWDEAIDAAQKAIALKPDFQLAKNNLAWSISQKQLERHGK
jgi:tetratricopeptide (TPR) repeat protein